VVASNDGAVIVTIHNDDPEVYEAAPPYAEEAAVKCVFCMVGETRPQQVTVEKYNEDGEMVTLLQNFRAHMCVHYAIQRPPYSPRRLLTTPCASGARPWRRRGAL
jgi:hypothetical protein